MKIETHTELTADQLKLFLKVYETAFADAKQQEFPISPGTEGKLVKGIAIMGWEDDECVAVAEINLESPHGSNDCFISGIGVIPKYRGKGLMRQTLEFVSKFAKEHGKETLSGEVIASEIEILNVLLRLGFEMSHSYLRPLTEEGSLSHTVIREKLKDQVTEDTSLTSWVVLKKKL